MKKGLFLLTVMGLLALATAAFAVTDTATSSFQTNVNAMAVVDVSGTAGNLTLVAPSTGGAAISAVSDATTYAQYTSVVSVSAVPPTTKTRSLDAKISSGTVPAGTALKLTPGTPTGTGTLGTAGSQITLSGTVQNILTAIGSCNTGTGGTAGSNLTYELSVTAIGSLVTTAANSVTITLTLNEEA